MEQFAGVYDLWGLQEEIRLLKVAQFEHAERLSQHSERIGKLEKHHDDSRIRSLWSTSSPFPDLISTFSQQPTNPERENFNGYDQQQQNLGLSGLPLDDVDVPRRGASRANSVRFDVSATTNHWIQDSPGTSDYLGQRPANSVGGYAMTERSSSHKSDNRSEGRQSLRSLGGDVSSSYEGDNGVFRPSTRGSDILDSCLHRSSVPRIGPAPAVLRCWLDMPSSYGPLLYAVVCTGSARSSIEMSLVSHLRLQDRIMRTPEGESKIELPVFLPDAIVQQHSRITGPSKLPRLTVEFMVLSVRPPKSKEGEKIRIFIGSDVIASHMGDVLFSQSKIFLHVDDGRKVFVPFIRPDAEDSFSDIFTAHSRHYAPKESEYGNGTDMGGGGSGMAGDSTRSLLSVSSPRPILGSQASVIRGVAAMEPPDFAPKDHGGRRSRTPTAAEQQQQQQQQQQGANNTYLNSSVPDVAGRPWTASGDSPSRKQSFGGMSSNDFAPSSEDVDGGIGVTRGRSLTNPFEDTSPIMMPKSPQQQQQQQQQQQARVWEGVRKSSMTQQQPAATKESNSNGTGTYSRGSSRGRLVLRTSKSFSSSEKANGTGSGAESATSTGPTKHASFKTVGGGGTRGHSRAMSGGDAIHTLQHPQHPQQQQQAGSKGSSSLVKTKSSNVVGGATAFHWMAPKTTAGEE